MRNKIIFVGLKGDGKGKEIVEKAAKQGRAASKAFFRLDNFSFRILLLPSREKINQKLGRKTPSWVVGGFNGKRKEVFVLAPWVFEKESCHSASSFSKILIHEIVHLYLYQLYPYNEPKWLTEGLAAYLAGQKRPVYSIHSSLFSLGFLRRTSSTERWEKLAQKGAYGLSFYWISFLADNYGWENLLKFIAKLAENEKPLEEVFADIFHSSVTRAEKNLISFLMTKRKGGGN